MRRSFILLLLGIVLASCNQPIKKSVIEPLEISDLKILIEKDSLFEITYQILQEIRNENLIDDVEKARWSDITYNRIHKIIQFYSDSLEQKKYMESIDSEYKELYGTTLSKIDSISDYWKEYKKENSLMNYIDIELFDIQTEFDFVEIGFKLTPLKESLDEISFDYVFIDKDDEEKIKDWQRFSALNENTVSYNYFKDIDEPRVHWKIVHKNKEEFKDKLLEEILAEYVFLFKLNSIKLNGIRLYEKDIRIPKNIKNLLESENSYMYEYYQEKVAHEFVDKNFLRFIDFKIKKLDSLAREFDLKAVEFLDLSFTEE